MFGQGGPQLVHRSRWTERVAHSVPLPKRDRALTARPDRSALRVSPRCFRWPLLVTVVVCIGWGWLSAAFPAATQAQITGVAPSEEINCRLRLAWGGGEPRRWRGRISLSDGEVLSRVSLGLAPESPGKKLIEQGELVILPHAASGFDGVDIELRAPEDAMLRVELSPADRDGPAFLQELTVADLLQQRLLEPLDDRNNWFSLQRSWGDELGFRFRQETLVFDAGQPVQFDVIPNQTQLAAGTNYEVRVSLRSVTRREELEVQTVNRTADDLGNLAPLNDLQFTLPDAAGVYEIAVEVYPKRLAAPLFRPRAALRRVVELIACPTEAQPPAAQVWRTTLEFDPAHPDWWERFLLLPQLTQLRVLPGLGKGPLDNGRVFVSRDQERSWTELAAGGWVAYPLPLKESQGVHLIEVETLATASQQLGVSFVEPNSVGQILPLGPDSGVVQQDRPGWPLSANSRSAWHGLLTWPNTPVPWLVIHNSDSEQSARFGRIRVSVPAADREEDLAGAVVEPLQLAGSSEETSVQPPRRRFALLLDSPLLPESFGGPERYDEVADRTLDDWSTFLTASERMVEALHLRQQRSAVISVLNEGSTIYPSRLLDPTPKYDSGAYFSSGQDPLRKDVLEMLFRMFDRESLTLIPQLEFSAPLPAVEAALRAQQRQGQPLTDVFLISDSEVLRESFRPLEEPLYNPLSLEVQAAVREVVGELVARYGHHPSFGGVSIRLGPNTYTHFPSDRVGYDFLTVKRYLQEQGAIDEKTSQETVLRAYYDLVRRRPVSYLRWRAERLAEFYGELSAIVSAEHPQATLYLTAANLFRDQHAIRSLHPRIQGQAIDVDSVLLAKGLVPAQLHAQPHLHWLEPLIVEPTAPLAKRRVEEQLEHGGQLHAVFAASTSEGQQGTASWQPVAPVLLEDFTTRGPFAADQTELVLFPRWSEAGTFARARFAMRLARADQQVLVDGAMLAPPTYSEPLRQFAKTFQALPRVPFAEVPVQLPDGKLSPLTLRRADIAGQTYIYAVNSTPWEVDVRLTLKGGQGVSAQPLADCELELLNQDGLPTQLEFSLGSYGLWACVLSTANVQISETQIGYHHPAAIRAIVDQQLRLYQAEVQAAGSRPLPWLPVPNASFEESSNEEGIPRWQVARQPGVRIEAEATSAHQGSHALRLASEGSQPAWIRSEPLPTPRTGRLSLSVWLRPETNQQPPLRMSIQGRHHGEEYYRFAELGSLAAQDESRQLGAEWKRFAVHFDDLPTEGLRDLRVGFDLMGAGTVWLDEVVVHDFWLDEQDVLALLKPRINLLVALEQGDYVTCLRYLETYWAQLLLARPSLRREAATPVADDRGRASRMGLSRGLLDRVKALAPQKIIPFR